MPSNHIQTPAKKSTRINFTNLPPGPNRTAKVQAMNTADGMYDNLPKGFDQAKVERVVTFLYMRGVGANLEKSAQVAKIHEFLEEKPLHRMLELLQLNWDDQTLDKASVRRRESWERLQLKLLRYLAMENVTPIFGDTLDKVFPLMVRSQKSSGHCCLHAVLAVWAYKSHFDRYVSSLERYRASTLDSNKVVMRSFNEEMLYTLIVQDKGGNSQELLQDLLYNQGLGYFAASWITGSDPECVIIEDLLKVSGPALISGFPVEPSDPFHAHVSDKFVADEILQFDVSATENNSKQETSRYIKIADESHTIALAFERICDANKDPDQNGNADTNEDADPKLSTTNDDRRLEQAESDDSEGKPAGAVSSTAGTSGTHAMVLIGCRRDETGKMWFLIQNTWRCMVLFEVSAEYLAHRLTRRSKITFICGYKPCTIPNDFQTLSPERSLNVDSIFDGNEDMTITSSPLDTNKM
jgi:hypothetical protein